jgi:hypothetical protein
MEVEVEEMVVEVTCMHMVEICVHAVVTGKVVVETCTRKVETYVHTVVEVKEMVVEVTCIHKVVVENCMGNHQQQRKPQ